MGALSWLRGLLPTWTDSRFWTVWLGGEAWAGQAVTSETALNISAWWRCVKLYAEITPSLPLKLYRRGAGDERVSAADHPLYGIIALDPNDEIDAWEFWSAHAAALAMIGNGYAEKLFIGQRLVGLVPLALDTEPFRDRGGALKYRGIDRGKRFELPADKVFHTRGFAFGGDAGLSPLSYARQTLSIALATEKSAGKSFAHGMRASGIFTGSASMSPEQRKQFRENYIKPAEGAENEGKSIVLPPDFKWQPISIPPKDAEMLLSRRFNVEDVCRWMGVPPILAGHAAEGQTMWGTGVENILLAWLTLGLNAFLSSIEKSINKRLLSPVDRQTYYAEFDRNGLLQADSRSRAEFISKMVSSAQMTPNEGRKKDNRPPMPGGDRLFINSTLVPIEDAGRKSTAAPPPASTDEPDMAAEGEPAEDEEAA